MVLHGHTMNGQAMQKHLGPLHGRLSELVDVVYAEAPHEAPPEVVDRLYALWNAPRLPPPHRTWWDATDDGREYRGLAESRTYLERICDRFGDVALLGFSQGAIAATVASALASTGELHPLSLAVLVAGRPPRADAVRPLFAAPLSVPSLHVWDDADPLAGSAPELAELYAPSLREIVRSDAGHRVPTHGHAAEAILRKVERFAS